MRGGSSYIQINDDEKSVLYRPNHPIIKKLKELGISNIEVIYASHWATDAGWNLQAAKTKSGKYIGMWLGFTIKESLVNIDNQSSLNYFE